ncbi:sugar phosphate isomerase/epimerase family protein [Desulfomicrobium baculatum]|uniref:Xylose isomerase domain protein TIM barrel n=1 Tax=Desulfomicrobium baculatum (strain DSM 4028 / VKM B-1378 / X) TaxID=525897 RepID=C7LWX0_DESBD|nr:TIM barrel protein [Desulfomicrobium baculatum]ACU91180.1 Xylose isomerase domain protein TIM barrel [Desulfomicrobium baculatum DSM 4028]
MTFTNLPLRYIEEHPRYLDLFLTRKVNPELGLDALALDTFSAEWHRRTARIFHDAGLTCAVHLPFFDLRPGSLDPMILKASRERLQQAVDTAQVYAPAHFIAHLDYNRVIYSHFQDAWLENSLRTWELVLDQTADAPLYLENVFELSPDHHVRVLQGLGGKAGACLDVGHWHCFAAGRKRGNLMQWLAALSPFPLHLHLHDNDGDSDAHLGLGQGLIPWDQLWTGLAGRKVSATFEPHTKDAFLATRNYLRDHDLKL